MRKFLIVSIIIILILTFLCACRPAKIDKLEKEVSEEGESITNEKETDSSITEKEVEPGKGQIVTKDKVKIYIPPQTRDIQPEIKVKEVTENIPAPPEDSEQVVEAYEITADSDISSPVLLTFSYDPDNLPEGTNEENLYIATLIEGSWETIKGGLIDTGENTISVSVEHFSLFGILESAKDAVYDVVEVIQDYTEDISRQSFSNLPQGIKDDLVDIVTQDIKSVVKLEISHLTKFASAIVGFANLVSETSELALDLVDGTRQAIVKGASLTAASLAADSELTGFSLMLYSSAETGKDVGKYLGGADLDPYTIAAEAAAWVLAMEMQYINDNMDKAFTGIYKYNPTSFSKLKMYAVFIDSRPVPDAGKPRMKGIKFYYYNEDKDEWVNYYNDIVTWEIKVEKSEEEVAGEEVTVVEEETEEVEEYVVEVPTTITVTPNSSPTLQEAVENLASGSTIMLKSGTYYISESITLDKELTISGSGKNSTEIVIDGYPLKLKGSGPYNIENTALRHSDSRDIIEVEDAQIYFNNCVFRDADNALLLTGSAVGSISYCEFLENDGGILLFDSSNLLIENNNFSNNSIGIWFYDDSGGTVSDSAFLNNSSTGILVTGNANPGLESNVLSGSDQGIKYFDNSGGVVYGNEITDCYQGIKLYDFAQTDIKENTITNNSIGIDYDDNSGGTAISNNCSDNSSEGIDVSGESNPLLENNICNNNNEGIAYFHHSGGTAKGNECSNNESDGIDVYDNSSPVLDGNICNYNGDAGIVFSSESSGEAENNECGHNYYGIYIAENANPYIGNNDCYGNESEDIYYE